MNEETPRQVEDRRLLEGVISNDQTAFSALYDRLGGPLYTLCLRMIGDADEAEDVLQETFVTLWKRASAYDASQSSVFGWSVHIARCKAIDHLRARGRRLRILAPTLASANGDEAEKPREPVAIAPDAADQANSNEEAGRVRQVLGALPAEQYQAIEMAFFGDLSHHEISARLGEPLGTIKARIRRGLLKLRDGLKGSR